VTIRRKNTAAGARGTPGARHDGSWSNIAGLLREPEGKSLEFKRDLSSLKPVLRALVAFANTAGGTLVIGRDDDGRVRGVLDPRESETRLANAVAEGIRPVLLPDIETVQASGRALLVVRVTRWPGPFYLAAEGPDAGVYVRLGSTTRRAAPEMVAELRRAAGHLVFDQLPCVGAELGDLDLDAAGRAFTSVGRDVDQAKLESLGVLIRYGRSVVPSNGGMILFGRAAARQRRFPDARVRCARFAGSDKAEFIDRLDFEGTVLDALEDVPHFIRRNTRMAARIEGMRRRDIPEYPSIALREALVNAVAHTDYSLTGMQIMVAVFADRLEIQNPGMLPFGMTLEDLRAGVSRIRNPVIARVLRELERMETWGSGYRRIAADCGSGGYATPEWIELGSAMRVVFRPHAEAVTAGASRSDSGRDQVGTKSGPSRDQVSILEIAREPRSLGELMAVVGWRHKTKFRLKFLRPLLDAGLMAMTEPDKPRSSRQRYVATETGMRVVAEASGDHLGPPEKRKEGRKAPPRPRPKPRTGR
jgi:predicted HTH transcriptional regulator